MIIFYRKLGNKRFRKLDVDDYVVLTYDKTYRGKKMLLCFIAENIVSDGYVECSPGNDAVLEIMLKDGDKPHIVTVQAFPSYDYEYIATTKKVKK